LSGLCPPGRLREPTSPSPQIARPPVCVGRHQATACRVSRPSAFQPPLVTSPLPQTELRPARTAATWRVPGASVCRRSGCWPGWCPLGQEPSRTPESGTRTIATASRGSAISNIRAFGGSQAVVTAPRRPPIPQAGHPEAAGQSRQRFSEPPIPQTGLPGYPDGRNRPLKAPEPRSGARARPPGARVRGGGQEGPPGLGMVFWSSGRPGTRFSALPAP
jgi:hypothetical protein